MSSMRLIVATPKGNLFDGPVGGLFLRGCTGDLAVLPGHVPFVTAVQSGICRIRLEDGSEKEGEMDGCCLFPKRRLPSFQETFASLNRACTSRSILRYLSHITHWR